MKITIKWNSLKFWWNEPFCSLNFYIPCTCKCCAIPRLCAHKFHFNINIKLWPPPFQRMWMRLSSMSEGGSAKKNWMRQSAQSALGTATVSHPTEGTLLWCVITAFIYLLLQVYTYILCNSAEPPSHAAYSFQPISFVRANKYFPVVGDTLVYVCMYLKWVQQANILLLMGTEKWEWKYAQETAGGADAVKVWSGLGRKSLHKKHNKISSSAFK